jgi:hypothetical protein
MDNNFRQRLRKVAVIDNRLKQEQPAYAVNIGPLYERYNKTPASSSNKNGIQVTIEPPGYNTHIERLILQKNDILGFIDVKLTAAGGAAIAANTPIFIFGRDGAPKAYPMNLHAIGNVTTSINGVQFSMDSKNLNRHIMRMINSDKHNLEQTCPSMLDKLVSYDDGFATSSSINVLGSYLDSVPGSKITNGSYPVVFTDSSGTVPALDTAFTGPAYLTDYKYVSASGQVQVATDIAAAANATFRLYYKIQGNTEPIVNAPFVYNDIWNKNGSLFEVKNIKHEIEIKNSVNLIGNVPSAAVGVANVANSAIINQGLNILAPNTPFPNCEFLAKFLDLPLTVQRPPECIIPYLSYDRVPKSQTASLGSGQSTSITSDLMQIGTVQDLIKITVSPSQYSNAGATTPFVEGQWNCAIQSVSLDYGNTTGLLTNATPYDLFKMSCQNGLQGMDYLQWSGSANIGSVTLPSTIDSPAFPGVIPTVGSELVIRPGVDFALPEGLVSGMGCRTTMQVTVTFKNQSAWSIFPELNVINVNSNFVRFFNGDGFIERNILTIEDVLRPHDVIDQMSLKRLVGAGVYNQTNNMQVHKVPKSHHVSAGSTKLSAGNTKLSAAGTKSSKKVSKKYSKKSNRRK